MRSFRFRLPVFGVALVLSALATAQTSIDPPDGGSKPPGGGGEAVRYDDHRLVNVTLRTWADVEAMLRISQDHWTDEIGPGIVPFRVPPDRLDALEASGLEFDIRHENIQLLIDQQRPGQVAQDATWFEDFKRYEEVNAYIDELVALRPDLVTKLDIGLTLEGRMIHGMRISALPDGTGARALFFNGCQHAREWITPMTTMYIADRFVHTYDSDPDVRAALDNLVFYIAPIVNVDGHIHSWDIERMWRKNRRDNGDGTFGVDNNRNWGFNWGDDASSSSDPSSSTYRGTAPFSEPENQVVRDFLLARPEIVAHIDFHSYGQVLISPHGDGPYGQPDEPDRTTFQVLNAEMAAAITQVHGASYTGYPSGSYLSGGFACWAHASEGILSWTFELRDTGEFHFILPADQILPTAEEVFEGVSVLTAYLLQPFEFRFPSGLPSRVTPDTQTSLRVDVFDIAETLLPDSATFFARVGNDSSFFELGLDHLGGYNYQATLPAAPCGTTVEYFFRAASPAGVITSPSGAPTTLHGTSAVDIETILYDTMETDPGWTVGDVGDGATTGIWVRVDPNGTAAQPEDDHTNAGTMCWVTGQGTVGGELGENDVDGGKTTLISPVLDLAGFDAVISFWLWYSNDTGAAPNTDTFLIDISGDAGGSWSNVETVGPTGSEASSGWYYREFRVSDVITPTADVQIRFVASDYGDGSLVEAAIDDFGVNMYSCPPQPLIVAPEGSRYVRITPPTGVDPVAGEAIPVALRVTSPDYPCLDHYVGSSGLVGNTPRYQTPDAWGTVHAHGRQVVPDTEYVVSVELEGGASVAQSSVVTAIWGDAVGLFQDGGWTPPNGEVHIIDITAALDRFANRLTAPILPFCDSSPEIPDSVLDIVDVMHMLDGFRGLPYPFANPCP